MEIDVKKLEVADYDIFENLKVALFRTWKAKIIIFLSTIIGALAFIVFYFVVGNVTTYSSSATIFSAVYGSYEASVSGVSIMNTYSGVLGTYRVCDRAAENLTDFGITSEELQAMVARGNIYIVGANRNASQYGYTLTLVTSSDNAGDVCAITNAMAQAFSDEINELLGTTTLQLLDESSYYGSSDSINIPVFFVLFCMGGMVLSACIIYVVEFFSKKVYSIRQCEMDVDMILGILPNIENVDK